MTTTLISSPAEVLWYIKLKKCIPCKLFTNITNKESLMAASVLHIQQRLQKNQSRQLLSFIAGLFLSHWGKKHQKNRWPWWTLCSQSAFLITVMVRGSYKLILDMNYMVILGFFNDLFELFFCQDVIGCINNNFVHSFNLFWNFL